VHDLAGRRHRLWAYALVVPEVLSDLWQRRKVVLKVRGGVSTRLLQALGQLIVLELLGLGPLQLGVVSGQAVVLLRVELDALCALQALPRLIL
jgi:hypothetical protein